ncbi:MAG: AraC family transcriptional regulator [Betaproteobacteria bacterium]|nr:AraC family transcriptional regulator [Betaproteobacteria bacterium]
MTVKPHTFLGERPRLMRSASLINYVELVRSLGRDPDPFLRVVGLAAKDLADPEALIPRDAARELLEITARATRTEDFALRLAAQRKLSTLGPISLVLREEATARQAIDTLCRYLKLVNASLILAVEDTPDRVIIREDLLPSPGLSMRQSVELAVGTLHRMLIDLVEPHWRPLDICFTHRAPLRPEAHRAFFGRHPRFNQEFNGLICSAADLAKPRPLNDEGAAALVRKYLEAALRSQSESLQDLTVQIIQALLPGGDCSADEVARHLQMDRRTLHRHLALEGLSYSGLLDRVRQDLVKRHLGESDLPLGEIAGLLGFGGLSSFSHWFRARMGCSASQWARGQGASRKPALDPFVTAPNEG